MYDGRTAACFRLQTVDLDSGMLAYDGWLQVAG
ncbi:hypothetical protein A2U01_0022401, partial [Trifolium medium]|nr:hypothetical protein [Trifolium medium]